MYTCYIRVRNNQVISRVFFFFLTLAFVFPIRSFSQDVPVMNITAKGSSYQEAYRLYMTDNRNERQRAMQLFQTAASEFLKQEDYLHYIDCRVKQAILQARTSGFTDAGITLDRVEPLLSEYVREGDSLQSDFFFAKASYLVGMTRYKEAVPFYQKAIDIRIDLDIKDNTLSYLYNNLGRTYHILRDYSNALNFFRKSFELKEKILAPDDPKLGSSYINYGGTLKDLGRYEEAIEFILKGAGFYDPEDSPPSASLAAAYNNLGLIYDKQADYQKALDYYQSALRIMERLDGNYFMTWVGNIHNNIGLIYIKLNEFEEALRWLTSSMEIKNLSGTGGLSSTYLNIAETYRELGNHKEATDNFLNAINYSINLKGEDNPDLSIYYLNYGMYLINQFNDLEKGKDLFEMALQLCRNSFGEKHPRTAQAYYNISRYFHQQEMVDSALYFIQKSIISLVNNFDQEEYTVNPELEQVSSYVQLLNSIKEKAVLTEKKFNHHGDMTDLLLCFSTLEIASSLIEEIRIGVQTEASKMILAQNEYRTYNNIIRLAFQIFKRTGDPLYKNRAFEYSEKSKSANLLAALRNSEAREIGGIPDDLIKREQELKSELNSYKLYVYEEKSKEDPKEDRIKIWEDYIFTLQTQFDSLISFLEITYPEYHALKFQINVTGHADLSKALNKNEVLIEYVVLDSVLFSFIHSKDDFLVHREPIDSLFHFNTRFIRDIVTNRKFSEGVKLDYSQFVHASFNLYQKLIHPFEDLIDDKDLIIVPDGTLAYIPFEVLISQLPDYRELDYKGLQYLLKNHSVSYSNSATLLVNSMKKQKKANRKLLAFAPNYLSDQNPEISRTATEKLYESLYPIPGVLEEVSRIQKILGGDIYLDEKATESSFKRNSANFGILHFAMHTVLDDTNPMFSKLVFANVSEDEEDGLLNTFEIYNLSLNARMAVLSSCNSGAGKMLRGEGVMSLARGFIYAGCPSIVMTLWEVEDNSGSAIMSDFYGYLKKGYSKNDALRFAKLDFLENATMKFAHPYFWSPYVSIGDTEPIFQKLYLRILALSLLVFTVLIMGRTLYKKLR